MANLEAGWYELISTRRGMERVSKTCFRIEAPDTSRPARDERAAIFHLVRVLKRRGWYSKLRRIPDRDFQRRVLLRHLSDEQYRVTIVEAHRLTRKIGDSCRMAEVLNDLR